MSSTRTQIDGVASLRSCQQIGFFSDVLQVLIYNAYGGLFLQ